MGKRKKEKHITKKVRVIEDDIRIAFAEAERELAEQTCQKMRSVKHERGRYLVVLIAYPTRVTAFSIKASEISEEELDLLSRWLNACNLDARDIVSLFLGASPDALPEKDSRFAEFQPDNIETLKKFWVLAYRFKLVDGTQDIFQAGSTKPIRFCSVGQEWRFPTCLAGNTDVILLRAEDPK